MSDVLIPGCEPPRPKRDDPAILEAAAKWMAERLGADDEDGKNANDILDAIDDCGLYSLDGYALAKFLDDNCSWAGVDEDMVADLAELGGQIHALHHAAVRKWVDEWSIKLTLASGQKVRATFPAGRTEDAVILQLIPSTAEYHISYVGGTRLVPAEDVEAVE